MVGTFYSSPSPDADAYVKAGSKVSKDSIVCIVEAMKLFNEIEAEVNGEIVEILAQKWAISRIRAAFIFSKARIRSEITG